MSSLTTMPTMEPKRSIGNTASQHPFIGSFNATFSNKGRTMRKLPLIDPGPDRNDTTTENIGNMLSLAQRVF